MTGEKTSSSFFGRPKGLDDTEEQLVDKVKENLGLADEEKIKEVISQVEEITGHEFNPIFDVSFNSPLQRKFSEIQELTAKELLEIITEEEEEELKELRTKIKSVADDVGVEERDILDAINNTTFQNFAELKDYLQNGPIVRGFSESEEVSFEDSEVRDIISNIFDNDFLQETGVEKITKDDKIRVHIEELDYSEIENFLDDNGIEYEHDAGFLLLNDMDDYYTLAKELEDKDSESELTHIFKRRAEAGVKNIKINSFGIEEPSDFDGIVELEELNYDEKMEVFIIGAVVHELGHHLEKFLTNEQKRQLKELFNNNISSYVEQHKEVHNSSAGIIFSENLAESVRLYATNPEYLKDKNKEVFDFFEKNISQIKKGELLEYFK